MDTGLLNLGEEHFSTYYVYEDEGPDDSTSLDDNNKSYFNEWEDERELNGDIGLIPEPSSFSESLKDISDITNSPPSELFLKMLDWSFIYVDGVDNTIPHPLAQQDLDVEKQNIPITNTFDDKEINNFDITAYINEPEPVNSSQKKIKSAGKKIDLEAQKYIVETKGEALDSNDDVIDVETVCEGNSLPVLEASDAFSLLEQFEASEKPLLSNNKYNDSLNNSNSYDFSASLLKEMDVNILNSSDGIFEKIPKPPADIFEDDNKLMKNVSEINKDKIDVVKEESKGQEATKTAKKVGETANGPNYVKNKQILDALPQELIARINEFGKRKTITVIPPIPTKKRGSSRSLDSSCQQRNKTAKIVNNNEQIQLDHDYCVSSTSPYPKEPQKDSGFQSSEEDDRSVIRNQPTVKNADGKLMVSLLKVNTIRNNNQKRKLNLEEYKKRRSINSNAASQSNSPVSSTCSSPLPEDENIKRIKHQEKLMKMAADLLNTPPKSAKKSDGVVQKKVKVENRPEVIIPTKIVAMSSEIVPPPDMEVKTYVSIGTNTDISSVSGSKNILASAQQLEEIKPLLQKVSDKINSNSFITSLIENIPKVKNIPKSYVKSENHEIVREDKIIHYLKKDRLPIKTNTVGTQTDFDEDDAEFRYRRRIDSHRSPSTSPSRSSTSSYRRRRNSSGSSRHSRRSDSSSSHSSRVSSRSRSRSVSPKRPRHYSAERLREVEERRVIYVGRIAKGTIKDDLRRRFQHFGPITNISLHFRDFGDNYGFVTFANKEDAYEAVEHGNDGHAYPKYDLSFGGRRIFCKTSYSDLDNMREDDYSYYMAKPTENSFDALLRAAQEKIRKRKP